MTGETPKVEITNEKEIIIRLIRQYFPRNADTMVAIAKAESQLNPNAIGYNCFYNSKAIYTAKGELKNGTSTVVYTSRVKDAYSTHCKTNHRSYAYSVDCGVLQKNYSGQVCPKESLEEHLEIVRDLSLIQGLEAWSAYNNGRYKNYLTAK